MKKTLLFISSILLGTISYAQYEGFENWTSNTLLNLDDYKTMIDERGLEGALAVKRSTDAFAGTYSIRLETVISPTNADTIFGFFLSGDPDTQTPGQATGLNGVDSIIGYYKYDIMSGDSCTLIASTFASSIPTGGGIFHIPTGTQTTWKRFAYAINALASDSLLLAAATGDPLIDFKGIQGTWIQFDNIQLKKGNQVVSVLNGGFENWTATNWEEPTNWKTSNYAAIFEPLLPVTKTIDKYAGNFAIELNTIVNNNNDTIAGLISNGDFNQNGLIGGQPFSGVPTAVEFYYKNTLSGVDTSWASIQFKSGGNVIATYGGQLAPVVNYTLVNQPVTLPMAADSVLIGAFAGENPGSKLFIDNIDLVFPVGVSENLSVEKLVTYPNPATDQIKIRFNLKNNSNVTIRLIDVTGKELTSRSLGQLSAGTFTESFNTSNYSSGIYFIEFLLDEEKIVERFTIK